MPSSIALNCKSYSDGFNRLSSHIFLKTEAYSFFKLVRGAVGGSLLTWCDRLQLELPHIVLFFLPLDFRFLDFFQLCEGTS